MVGVDGSLLVFVTFYDLQSVAMIDRCKKKRNIGRCVEATNVTRCHSVSLP